MKNSLLVDMKELGLLLLELVLRLAFILGKITLCIVIIGLYGFLCYEIIEIASTVDKLIELPTFLIVIVSIVYIAIIVGCIVCCIASIYFLFNGYAIYIIEKTFNLYNKPDGEYVIIPNSKWLFWLPLFCTKAANTIGLKAKKNGNIVELSGIKRDIPYTLFRSIFGKNYLYSDHPFSKYFPPIYFNQFSKFGDTRYGQDDRILFTHHNGVCLFKLIRIESGESDEYDKNADERNASERSYNHLMEIYFGGMSCKSEEEKIFYNIITQNDENKIIKKKIEEDRIIEYYYDDYKKDGHWWDPWLVIEKITHTKEGFYFYSMRGNSYFLLWLNIKEFMQKNGICPRGLFEYGNDKELNYGSKCDGAMIYCLDGNYFMLQWDKDSASSSSDSMPHEYSSIYIKPLLSGKHF